MRGAPYYTWQGYAVGSPLSILYDPRRPGRFVVPELMEFRGAQWGEMAASSAMSEVSRLETPQARILPAALSFSNAPTVSDNGAPPIQWSK